MDEISGEFSLDNVLKSQFVRGNLFSLHTKADMLSALVVLLMAAGTAVADANVDKVVTDRAEKAILTIRVDQKGSSYIIHPDLNRMEAEALLAASRTNNTSFFYNVTGMTEEARSSPTYQTTASAKLFEALLSNIKTSTPSLVPIPDQATARHDTEWVVHNGDAISVEDVTHKVFHAATNRVSAQQHHHHHHHPLLAALPMAHKPEQLIPSSLVKARPSVVRLPTSTTVGYPPNRIIDKRIGGLPPARPARPVTKAAATTTTTTRRTTTPSTTTIKRAEDPNLRSINNPPEGEQDFYDEDEYEEYEEEVASTTLKTTSTKQPTVPTSVSTKKAIIVSLPARPSTSTTERGSPVGMAYLPPSSVVTNKNGILTLSKTNTTIPPLTTWRLPEYTIKTGGNSLGGNSVNSSSLVTKTEPMSVALSSTTKPTTTTTTKPTTTTKAEAFDLADFFARVAGDASEVLMEPSIPAANTKPVSDSSILGHLFSSAERRRHDENEGRPSSAFPSGNLNPPPPQRSGSVHNLNRPGLFSAFNAPPDHADASPGDERSRAKNAFQSVQRQRFPAASGGFRPMEHHGQHRGKGDVGHHTVPNTDALIPLYSTPDLPALSGIARVTEQPGEVDVITAPSQWNLIVKSSLTSTSDKMKSVADIPVPAGSLSHRHGYIIDQMESSEGSESIAAQPESMVASDGLMQHQDSPSRLGVAIDYDQHSQIGQDKGLKPHPATDAPSAEYVSYEDYEDYAEEPAAEPATNRSSAALNSSFDRRKLVVEEPIPPSSSPSSSSPSPKLPPLPYGLFNLGDLEEETSPAAGASGASSSEEMEGFGAAFPELISNSVRRLGVPTSRPATRPAADEPHRHHLDVEEKRPEVFQSEQAIDAYDKKFRTVEVDADLPVNTTTIPHDSGAVYGSAASGELSGAALTYILIGTFGGLSLLFLCAVGITIRCRKRRFMFSTFATSMMRRRHADDEESQSGSPNALTGRRMANQQLAGETGGKGEVAGEAATHKLGSWFTGRNSVSSLHGGSQVSRGTRKLRAEVALPRTTPNTPGKASAGSKTVTTRAYFTDGRTGSTRDLITTNSSTAGGSSDSSGAESPDIPAAESPRTPHRNSWLHTSYSMKDRGNSLSELRDSSYYCLTHDHADAASSDGERPRSTSATVRSPLHHFRSTEGLDSIESIPPDLPPKRQQQRFSMGDSMSVVDPMGSHLTIQTEASATSNWGSVEDRLI